MHPGVVTAQNLKDKISKQLKIDLDDSEHVHIFRSSGDADSSADESITTASTLNFAELDEVKIQTMADEFTVTENPCTVKINRLGEYLAVIGLKGGYSVPLRFLVRQRA